LAHFFNIGGEKFLMVIYVWLCGPQHHIVQSKTPKQKQTGTCVKTVIMLAQSDEGMTTEFITKRFSVRKITAKSNV